MRKHPEAIPSAVSKPKAPTTSRRMLKHTNKQLAETGYTSETPPPVTGTQRSRLRLETQSACRPAVRNAQQQLPEVHQSGILCPLCKSDPSSATMTHVVGHCGDTATVRQTTWTHCKSLTWSRDDDRVQQYQNSLNAALDSQNAEHTQGVQSWVAVTLGAPFPPCHGCRDTHLQTTLVLEGRESARY